MLGVKNQGAHMAKKKGILDRLKEGPVLGDGGYLLELEKRGWVRAGPFTPEVALLQSLTRSANCMWSFAKPVRMSCRR